MKNSIVQITKTSGACSYGESKVEKWTWMMDWCLKHRLPPANEEVWQQAAEAFDNLVITKEQP